MRLTILTLGVFCFVLMLTSTADAGPRHRVRERRVTVERKVEKVEPLFHLLPSRCPGGQCPTK